MERIINSVDYQSKGWDKYFKKLGNRWRNKDYRYLIYMFNLKKLKGSLLDVGCALGDGLSLLTKRCPNITSFSGTDFSKYSIKANNENPLLKGIDFFHHDILEPLPKNYDNILCLQTLEHVTDPIKAMRNLIEATNHILIASTPYLNRRPDENHLWKFDENDFKDLVDEYYLGRKKRNIYWIVNKLPDKQKLRKTPIPRFLEKIIYKYGNL